MLETLSWYSQTIESLAPGLMLLLGLVIGSKLLVVALRWLPRG